MSKKPYIHKRIIAYFVDILIISMLSSILALPISNNNDTMDSYNELTSIVKKYQDKEITEEEYLTLYNDLNYDLTKSTVNETIIIAIVSILYFVVLNYYYNGQTFGKKLMKLKIVSNNDNKLSINNYLIRCLIVNTTLANIITAVLILTLSKEKYLLYEGKFSTVFGVIYILCFVFALYRNDGRGLHDLIANTKVVNASDEIENKVLEAEVVSEQKEEIKKVEENKTKKDNKNKNVKKEVKK